MSCWHSAIAQDLTLRGEKAEQVWATAGGALVSIRFRGEETNPLTFEIPAPAREGQNEFAVFRGHFLCLDRWGAPSAAEQAHGMAFHGEAPAVRWKITSPPKSEDGRLSGEMSCELPLAGMRVARRIVLDDASPVVRVSEQVTNSGNLGRIYNMVQHPTIAPPFLDDDTLIDSNARMGFFQDGPIPTSRERAGQFPMLRLGGAEIDLRRLRTEPGEASTSDVSSFVFGDDERLGWVTASSPRHKLLLGYLWKTADYPWLNLWRFRIQGKPAARGLEFGTSGYHQPFPTLVRQGQILGRPTYVHLDADETIGRSYLCFLARIVEDFQGVQELTVEAGSIRLRERRDVNPRVIELPTKQSVSD